MPNHDPPTRYTGVAQSFHWIIAGLIVTQFILGWTAVDLPLGLHKLARFARHKSFGMTVLVLAILRLLWRVKHPPPAFPPSMTSIARVLARSTHLSLSVLLFP